MIVQAVCDSFFLLFANLVYTGASHLSPAQYLPLLKSIPILLPLIHISLTGSVYTTVAVAVERYTTFVEALSKVMVDVDSEIYDKIILSQQTCARVGSSSL